MALLLDETTHGDASLLSPAMRQWQGPSLLCYNDAQFTPQDFRNICSIGSNSKLASAEAIGRFGLGFNAVYHFTDVPSFVSGDHIVYFDPHAESLPGATAQNPGLKIRFVGAGYLEQFPDQFSPYCAFGNDMDKPFPGTLFRFPLRTAEAAASSKLRQEAYGPDAVRGLLDSIHARAAEILLFLKNVRSLEVLIKRAGDDKPALLFRAERHPPHEASTPGRGGPNGGAPAASTDSIVRFVRGGAGSSKGSFYQRLQATDISRLPRESARMHLTVTTGAAESVASANDADAPAADADADADVPPPAAAAATDADARSDEGSSVSEHGVGAKVNGSSRGGEAARKAVHELVREEEWLVCSSLGRDAPRICEMCLTREGRQMKLMPWGRRRSPEFSPGLAATRASQRAASRGR